MFYALPTTMLRDNMPADEKTRHLESLLRELSEEELREVFDREYERRHEEDMREFWALPDEEFKNKTGHTKEQHRRTVEAFRRISNGDYRFDTPPPKDGDYLSAVCYDGHAVWGKTVDDIQCRLSKEGYGISDFILGGND